MLNELKKESLKKVLVWVVLWAVVAAGCFVYALPGVFAMLGGAKELGSLSVEELEGSYVKTDISASAWRFRKRRWPMWGSLWRR